MLGWFKRPKELLMSRLAELRYKDVVSKESSQSNSADTVTFEIYQYIHKKQYDVADEILKSLLIADSENAEYWEMLGQCLSQVNTQDAKSCFERCIALDANRIKSYVGLGDIYQAQGKLSDAENHLKKALSISENDSEVLIKLAGINVAQQSFEEALAHYVHVEAIDRSKKEFVLLKQAACLSALGRFPESERIFYKLLGVFPKNEEIYYEFALMYLGKEEYTLAERMFKELIEISPKDVSGYLGLALVMSARKEFKNAYEILSSAREYGKNSPIFHTNMAAMCDRLGDRDSEVQFHLDRASDLNGGMQNHTNNAVRYANKLRFAEVFAETEAALKIDPEAVHASTSKAVNLLLLGFYEEGWKEYHLCRMNPKLKDYSVKSHLNLPFWDGKPDKNKSIVVIVEQGFGDVFHFVRYTSHLKSLFKRVVLSCYKPQFELLKCLDGIEVVIARTDEQIDCDFQVPILSLPYFLNTHVSNIPNQVPYIYADKSKMDFWAVELLPWQKNLKVGLVWAGGISFAKDKQRSTRLEQFANLFQLENVTYFSLQKGDAADQSLNLSADVEFINFTHQLTDFSDTAALISHLDLVIAVDTGVAHLAGALGKPVWILLPYSPDFRWMLGREDSPWYPTAWLFRQSKYDDWESVFDKLYKAVLDVSLEKNPQKRLQRLLPPQRSLDELREEFMNVGREAFAKGNFEKAQGAFQDAVNIVPAPVNAWYNLGLAYQSDVMGSVFRNQRVAKTCYQRALVLSPADAGIYHNLATISANESELAEAITYFESALLYDSQNIQTIYSLSRVLHHSLASRKAFDIQKQGLDIEINRLTLLNFAMLTLIAKGDQDEALNLMRQAIEYPLSEDVNDWLDEAKICTEMNQYQHAINMYELVLRNHPDNYDAEWGLALLKLKLGDYIAGWEHFECRWNAHWNSPTLPQLEEKFGTPLWDGQAMPKATILVHGEYGLGDMIQFSRYILILEKLFLHVIVDVPFALVRLFKASYPNCEVMTREPNLARQKIPSHDVRVTVMTLPKLLGTTLDSVPSIAPSTYLVADKESISEWRGCSQMELEKFRVGLVWAGNPGFENDKRRSMKTQDILPLLSIKGIQWWSLQKNNSNVMSYEEAKRTGLVDMMDLVGDLADTAAIIANLDLVISVDTAVAHLAAAMGKAVWIMLPYDSDWRWMVDGTDNKWYCTARLFRQGHDCQWTGVVEQVRNAIEEVTKSPIKH